MKIIEYIKSFFSSLQPILKKWSVLITAFIITSSGFYSSVAIFQYLGKRSIFSDSKAKRDTVYVKLIDSFAISQSTRRSNDPGTASSSEKVDTPAGLKSQTFPPIAPLRSTTINQGVAVSKSAKDKIVLDALLKQQSFPWWLVLLAAFILAAGVIYVIYSGLPYFSDEMRKDVDPTGLTELFDKYGNQIQDLGNPRKIKRFSNKIRFQFYYLQEKQLDKPVNLDALFRILLLFEKLSLESSIEPDVIKKIRDSKPEFEHLIEDNNIALSGMDEKCGRIIYSLNRDYLF